MRTAILTKPNSSAPPKQNLTLLRIYVAYRSLLCVVLLIMLVSPNTRQLVGILNPALYVGTALAYLATSIALIVFLSARSTYNQNLLFFIFIIDILAITVLADTSRGMEGGLPILLVITVAASSLLISNRTLATLVAALSVMATLADTLHLISRQELNFNALFPAGLLGVLIFGVSLLMQSAAIRLGRAETLARDRASELYNLQRLNEQIVQHMQAGILLVSDEGFVRVMNKAASVLLAPERPLTMEHGRQLADYNAELANQFEHWKNSGLHRTLPFTVMQGAPKVIANFRELQPSSNRESLVFVQDYTPITQHAQSLKLRSLGRLTASIAHEIRNPLGAISHAAQLMRESSELSEPDRRMTDIIVDHCGRVNEIIKSVMQISSREAPKPEYLVLGEWLEETVAAYLKTLNRDVEVSVDCQYKELLVEFDPENLQRILTNLLDNALRHSKLATAKEIAQIVVSLDFSTHQCLVDIIDIGKGVAPEDQASLFEPFYTTVQEGSGMGLYLCKELCEINNASLSYTTTALDETCFRISMIQRAV
ncbi:MAG: two-component system sensor histidine kinase PilS (NtrC family) [Halioglobus sp.]|jgi:two-component system sensor histidine kinase PilS (NtrC family)